MGHVFEGNRLAQSAVLILFLVFFLQYPQAGSVLLVVLLAFDRAASDVRLDISPNSAIKGAFILGTAASGVLSITFLSPRVPSGLTWLIYAVAQWVVLALIAYCFSALGTRYPNAIRY